MVSLYRQSCSPASVGVMVHCCSGDCGRRRASFAWQVAVLDPARKERPRRQRGFERSLANGHRTQAAISADGTAVVFDPSRETGRFRRRERQHRRHLHHEAVRGGVACVSVASHGSQPIAGQSVTPASAGRSPRRVHFHSSSRISGASTCRRHPAVASPWRRSTCAIQWRRTTSRSA